ncbi:hypothetical protein PFISCL1PPCAC_12709, partial [Pristionchus fissidentatus]
LFHTSFRTTIRLFSASIILYAICTVYLVVECSLQETCSRRKIPFSVAPVSVHNIVHETQYMAIYAFWLALTFIAAERGIASSFVITYETRFHS